MASVRQNYDTFHDYPGSINEGTGEYEFPTLWYKDSRNNYRQWNIYIRLIKKKDYTYPNAIDWNVLKANQVKIKNNYFDMEVKISSSIIAEIWTESGIDTGKITRNIPTYVTEPIYKDQINERNVFQQALSQAAGLWQKQVDKGRTQTREVAATADNVMYFPQLAKSFKDGEKHIVYPAYIQPKLDGVRCIIYLKTKNSSNSVIAYSRAKKIYPSANDISEVLYKYLNELYDSNTNQSIYLDGELYKHGKTLQQISGDSRNITKSNKNEYHIYDCFYPKNLDLTFENREIIIRKLFDKMTEDEKKIIKYVPTITVANINTANQEYKKFIDMGYEGAMLRNKSGKYLADPNKTGTFLRSNDLVKMKPTFTDEFECIGFTEGKNGKDKGAIIWICVTESGFNFNVTPKDINYEERYKLFKECKKYFEEKYIHRQMTIEYQDLSDNGVPLRAKSLGFRDIL